MCDWQQLIRFSRWSADHGPDPGFFQRNFNPCGNGTIQGVQRRQLLGGGYRSSRATGCSCCLQTEAGKGVAGGITQQEMELGSANLVHILVLRHRMIPNVEAVRLNGHAHKSEK